MFGKMALLLCLPGVALAQEEPSWSTLSVEAYAGGASFGRFLEQRFAGGERELTPDAAFAAGGAVNVYPFEKTWLRVGYTWVGSELEYHDDSGFDVETREREDLSFLASNTASLEALTLFLDPVRRFNPYAVAGVTGTLWSLGDDELGLGEVRPGEDDTLLRFGANAGLGLQARIVEDLVLRAEVNNFGLGNPFDGNNAFRTGSGLTFSEPPIVRMTRYTLGLTYVFGV